MQESVSSLAKLFSNSLIIRFTNTLALDFLWGDKACFTFISGLWTSSYIGVSISSSSFSLSSPSTFSFWITVHGSPKSWKSCFFYRIWRLGDILPYLARRKSWSKNRPLMATYSTNSVRTWSKRAYCALSSFVVNSTSSGFAEAAFLASFSLLIRSFSFVINDLNESLPKSMPRTSSSVSGWSS